MVQRKDLNDIKELLEDIKVDNIPIITYEMLEKL